MARKAQIDYSKPFYINSFRADEIIFHIIRGICIRTGKYDGSLPVSLDSLKLLEICGKKEIRNSFEKAIFKTGADVKKSFCDAVVNIDFSDAPDYTDKQHNPQRDQP